MDLDGRTTIYLSFRNVSDPRKRTKDWEVTSVRSGNVLGYVAWKSSWRQYAFFPSANTIWNEGCLDDIKAFLADAMTDWRAARKEASKS